MILLQASITEQITSLLPLILAFVVLYLLVFRPQQKKQKDQKKFNQEVQKGDLVATSSGIIGRINKIEEGVITLQVDAKTFIRVVPDALSKDISEAIQNRDVGL